MTDWTPDELERIRSTDEQMTDETTGWTGGRRAFGGFAPGLVHYTDAVLFDEVWERPQLSKRDRSLVTVAALLTAGSTEQLNFHLEFAKRNGVTEDELIEAITHLAFYAGWPRAMSAMTIAKKIFTAHDDRSDGRTSTQDKGELNHDGARRDLHAVERRAHSEARTGHLVHPRRQGGPGGP